MHPLAVFLLAAVLIEAALFWLLAQRLHLHVSKMHVLFASAVANVASTVLESFILNGWPLLLLLLILYVTTVLVEWLVHCVLFHYTKKYRELLTVALLANAATVLLFLL